VCVGVERVGKRIVLEMERELFLVLHLMIAGRLRWTDGVEKGAGGKIEQARFVFDNGTLTLTEGRHQEAGVAAHCARGVRACVRSIAAAWTCWRRQ
jgi:formamidopyrimidine-DNA glycosylase